MKPDQLKIVTQKMAAFRCCGGYKNRKKQYNRLLAILNDIFEHEPESNGQIKAIGRRQVIGYWKRSSDSYKVKCEKYNVLAYFFKQIGKPIPPRPKQKKEHLGEDLSKEGLAQTLFLLGIQALNH